MLEWPRVNAGFTTYLRWKEYAVETKPLCIGYSLCPYPDSLAASKAQSERIQRAFQPRFDDFLRCINPSNVKFLGTRSRQVCHWMVPMEIAMHLLRSMHWKSIAMGSLRWRALRADLSQLEMEPSVCSPCLAVPRIAYYL